MPFCVANSLKGTERETGREGEWGRAERRENTMPACGQKKKIVNILNSVLIIRFPSHSDIALAILKLLYVDYWF